MKYYTIEISAAKYWPKYSQNIQSLKETLQKFRNKRFFFTSKYKLLKSTKKFYKTWLYSIKHPTRCHVSKLVKFQVDFMTFSPFYPHAYPMAFQIPIMVVVVRITHLKYFKEGDCVTITKSLFKNKSKKFIIVYIISFSIETFKTQSKILFFTLLPQIEHII